MMRRREERKDLGALLPFYTRSAVGRGSPTGDRLSHLRFTHITCGVKMSMEPVSLSFFSFRFGSFGACRREWARTVCFSVSIGFLPTFSATLLMLFRQSPPPSSFRSTAQLLSLLFSTSSISLFPVSLLLSARLPRCSLHS